MLPKYQDIVARAADSASQALGVVYDLDSAAPIGRPDFKDNVADSALAVTINALNRRDDAVMLVSNKLHPDFVSVAVSRSREIAAQLSAKTAAKVTTPLYAGRIGAQSFAVYPRLEPFSENKIVRLVQRKVIENEVVDWLVAVVNESKRCHTEQASVEEYFVRPLQYVAREPALCVILRSFAERALEGVSGEAAPFTVIQHGDFWCGNILFDRSRHGATGFLSRNFHVIDWGGGNLNGYPFIDIIRYLRSTMKDGATAAHVARYARLTNLPVASVQFYVAVALGHLGLNRNQFPFDRYVQTADDLFAYTQRLNIK